MSHRTTTIIALGGMMSWASAVGAAGLAPARASHVVNLVSAARDPVCDGAFVFYRAGADGSLTVTPFEVPDGQVLVVTSGQATVFDIHVARPTAFLEVHGPANRTTVLFAGVTPDANGSGHVEFTMPTGLVVGAGSKVCLGDNTGSEAAASIQGFLAPAR